MAISITLLELYHALFERSCDAVNALSSALVTFYRRRGYQILSAKGESIQEPFRCGLGYAVQWYDCLRLKIDKQVEDILTACNNECKSVLQTADQGDSTEVLTGGQTSYLMSFPSVPSTPHATRQTKIQELRTPQAIRQPLDAQSSPVKNLIGPSFNHTLCDRYLRQMCPACFAGSTHGRPFATSGGDIHVAIDGNFHHRHLASSGDTLHFYDAKHFVPKREVDLVGERIDKARKSGKQKVHTSKVPDEAIDACKESYHAAKGDQQNAASRRCDVNGLMALVCRHDIPIFFADIDTPGEQQKYAVALIERLFSLLPPNATVVVLYDIGCVLDRSLRTYDILPMDVVARLQLATAAMHAYGHQWSCQLIYNPRLQEGMGLTDGEGTEWLWSRMRRLIGVERNSARSRRVWLIDRQAMSIADEHRDQLGDWIARRLHKGVEHHSRHTTDILRVCDVPIQELREEWIAQREAQLSIRAHAPARLKKELNNIFALQSDLDAVDAALSKARVGIKDSGSSGQNALEVLARLTLTHEQLKNEVEALYSALNVPHAIPDLHDVDISFVHTLFLARDLKMNIRKKAIGSFLEWDRLDQAVGGRGQPLGTKLHQQTKSAIAKRKPALAAAIRKYNNYCQKLADLRPPDNDIPVPRPLPTDLTQLRNNNSELMEDVWISPTPNKKVRWLDEPEVREGIRAMLKQQRCLEERRRLGVEADNLCRWFGEELCAVELALRRPEYAHFHILLKQKRDHLLLLKKRWTNPMVHALRFDEHIRTAEKLAQQIMGAKAPTDYVWLTTIMVDNIVEDSDDLTRSSVPEGLDSQDTVIADLLEEELEDDPIDPPAEIGPVQSVPYRAEHIPMVIDAVDLEETRLSVHGLLNAEDSDSEVEIISNIARSTMSSEAAQVKAEIRVHWTTLMLSTVPTMDDMNRTRVVKRSDGRIGVVFETDDINRIAKPRQWLSSSSINGCATLFQAIFSSQKDHAIFSTYSLVHIRNNVNDEVLWRNTQGTRFWKRPIWVLPIHRENQSHWVLAIVQVTDRLISVFDSFAQGPKTWSADIEAITTLVTRLATVAKKNGEEMDITLHDWSVRSLTPEKLQTNQHDCGMWVLTTIAATLRGYDLPSLTEKDMPQVRKLLSNILLSLPCA
ncbi:hypothetical protein M378DRAFT_1061934 [Amanita muscaria Koide BX008]|uniref:Ubiquitin-like protease family profile domain-containing protein n=1 Tax=Amanita muscaria (strain Koide BX008) TaxID=946122 RepID=A0A0C2WHG1_AMAMK|nr:hypothetical protein M378DRAFT_1061934 [Amanita muscaria Koide BX008]